MDEEVRELNGNIESKRTAAEQRRRDAQSLRSEASEMRATANRFEDDVAEIVEYLKENPELRVFVGHGKIERIADDHGVSEEDVWDAIVAAGIDSRRIGEAQW